MLLSAGIDIGSTVTKAVVFDGSIRSWIALPTGWNPKESGMTAFGRAVEAAGISTADIEYTLVTGYGRVSLPFADGRITEITCHAAGARYFLPDTRTVLDIGGQDSKAIALNDDGTVADFVMNDKCAAGTGRFLQVMAGILDCTLDELAARARATTPAPINSMCTVFAESEVIGLLAQGTPKDAVAAGVIHAIARKLPSLLGRVTLRDSIAFTGGLATNPDICALLSHGLDIRLHIPEHPQIAGALGAAILAHNEISRRKHESTESDRI